MPTPAAEASESVEILGRILVVDDEPINLQVLKTYLTGERFAITLAQSGEEALRRIAEERIDLVLLDVMMPRLSGHEVCRILRQTRNLSELPVIFLTARTQESDLVAGLESGANDFLTKPISKDQLRARLRPHLELLRIHRHLDSLVEEKMSEIKVLEGLLPICANCKKIRNESGDWLDVEVYIDDHSEVTFSHGCCPDCIRLLYRDLLDLPAPK